MSFDGPSGALGRSSERRFDCGQPSMHFFRLPSIAAAAACRSRQRPRASSARLRSRHADRRDCCLPQSGDPQWSGRTRPQPSQCLATTVRLFARLLPVVREVSEGSRRPSAVSGMPLPPPNRRHGVPCLARCISPVTAVFSRPGTSDAVFRARAGFPRQTPDCSRRVRLFRTTGCSPVHGRSATVNAELLRRAQDALDFRVAPARPSKDGSKARRTIQASSVRHQLNLPAAPAATGAATHSAPRHYRIAAIGHGEAASPMHLSPQLRVGSDGTRGRATDV